MALERVWKMLSAKWDLQIAGMVFQKCSYHSKNITKLTKQAQWKITGFSTAPEFYQDYFCKILQSVDLLMPSLSAVLVLFMCSCSRTIRETS